MDGKGTEGSGGGGGCIEVEGPLNGGSHLEPCSGCWSFPGGD